MISLPQQIDMAWLLLGAGIVLIGQFGFACLATSINRPQGPVPAGRNTLYVVAATLFAFWLLGFGLLHWRPLPAEFIAGNGPLMGQLLALNFWQAPWHLLILCLWQGVLASFMAVSLAAVLAGRINLLAGVATAVVIAVLVLPVAGHWSGTGQQASGWLGQLGLVDFAGGATLFGCLGAAMLAARLSVSVVPGQPDLGPGAARRSTLALCCLLPVGLAINVSPAASYSYSAVNIALCSLLAALSALVVSRWLARLSWPAASTDRLLPWRACLVGLVAVSAGCHGLGVGGAVVIGGLAAVVMMSLDRWLRARNLADPQGLIAVLLGGGWWGLLATAWLIDPQQLAAATRGQQFAVQLLGGVALTGWSFAVVFWLLKTVALFYPLGRPAAVTGSTLDVNKSTSDGLGGATSQRSAVADSIDGSVLRAQTILRDMHGGLLTFRQDGVITSFNPAAEGIFSVSAEAAIGRSITTLFANERKIRAEKNHRLFGLFELNKTVDTYGLRPGCDPFRLEVSVTKSDLDGRYQYIAQVRDIQRKRRLENQLFKEQKRALVTLGSIADGVITTDQHGKVTYLNAAAERQTGWDSSQALSYPFEQIFTVSEDGGDIQSRLQQVLAGASLSDDFNQTTLVSRSGTEQPVSYTLAPIKDQFGETFGSVAVFRDVSSTQALQRRLSYQATHDDLTGVLNRNGFESKAKKLLNRSVNYGEQHVLAFMDLDQFKAVNDTCGHQAGDELLRQIAYLIKKQLRSDDTLARMGGDEFCVLLQNCDERNGLHIAEIIRDAIAAYRFSWEGKQFGVGASIGLVNMSKETPSLPKLLSLADSACYAAKDQGRNRVNVYKPNDLELAERRGQVEWVAKIRQALDSDSLRLFYQPIKALQVAEDEVQHIEVFVHLLGENGKLVPPGAFIPAAERYSVIQEVDMWVVRNALSWLGEFQSASGNAPFICSINLSGTTISDKQSLENIIQIIDDSGVDTRGICFEITETAAIGNFEAAKRFIIALKEKGCSFSLDDFGSGLSSFGYLKNLPVDYLKIDGVFIKDILNNRVDQVMVDSITKLAHELGLKTVAEFVSCEQIAEQLRLLGVGYAQGYYLAKPQPLQTLFSGEPEVLGGE